MGSDTSIDRILSPWLYENGATPPETRLQSTADGGSGSVRLTVGTVRASATILGVLRAEVQADVSTAIRSCEQVATGQGLQITDAIKHVHDRWEEKLKHLVSDMDDRAGRLTKAADNWERTERDNTKAFEETK